jgi:hypothetical protein
MHLMLDSSHQILARRVGLNHDRRAAVPALFDQDIHPIPIKEVSSWLHHGD